MAANGLTRHPDKTQGGDCSQPGQGFEFLGDRFEAGRRQVRQKSLAGLKDRIRACTGRSRGDSRERISAERNPIRRGWFGYVKQASPVWVVKAIADDAPTAAGQSAQAGSAAGLWPIGERSPRVAECLLRGS